jgi:hypothetical protein
MRSVGVRVCGSISAGAEGKPMIRRLIDLIAGLWRRARGIASG